MASRRRRRTRTCEALYGVLKIGPDAAIPDKHVGSTGSHRDESQTLRLDDVAARDT